jgi:hypothetical protein
LRWDFPALPDASQEAAELIRQARTRVHAERRNQGCYAADARAEVLERLSSEIGGCRSNPHAVRLLLAAAKIGSFADRKAATDQAEIVLKRAVS